MSDPTGWFSGGGEDRCVDAETLALQTRGALAAPSPVLRLGALSSALECIGHCLASLVVSR